MGERIVGDGTPNRDFVAKEEVDLGKALSACSKFLWREEYQSYRMLIVATITRILSSRTTCILRFPCVDVKIPIDAVETLPADILRVTKIEGEKRDMKGVMICVNCIACLCTYRLSCSFWIPTSRYVQAHLSQGAACLPHFPRFFFFGGQPHHASNRYCSHVLHEGCRAYYSIH